MQVMCTVLCHYKGAQHVRLTAFMCVAERRVGAETGQTKGVSNDCIRPEGVCRPEIAIRLRRLGIGAPEPYRVLSTHQNRSSVATCLR